MTDVLNYVADGLMLSLVVGIPLYGFIRKVNVLDVFVEGAAEGFPLMLKILPHLIAMIVAIGMLRASGFFVLLATMLKPALAFLGIPADLVSLILMRPFSGAASNAILVDLIHQHGGNSAIAHIAAVIIGSTETTFYVLAVYFGAAKITKIRHAAVSGLLADFVGIVVAIMIGHWVWA